MFGIVGLKRVVYVSFVLKKLGFNRVIRYRFIEYRRGVMER